MLMDVFSFIKSETLFPLTLNVPIVVSFYYWDRNFKDIKMKQDQLSVVLAINIIVHLIY